MSKFRLSNHRLMIEKGRHNNRKCPFCLTHIEDETHFLINCPIYSSIRKPNGKYEKRIPIHRRIAFQALYAKRKFTNFYC